MRDVLRLTPAVRMGLSIGIATGLYAISFGALGVAAGLTVMQTCALSLLMFTGGSQFAFVGVIGGGGSWGAATTAASLLGVRNAVYGVAMNELLRPRGLTRPVMAQLTIDESTAVASSQVDDEEQKRGFWAAGLAVYVFWNLFTLVGAMAGAQLGDPAAWGLDGAAVAAFLALLWPRLKGRAALEVAVLCAVVTLLVTSIVPPGIPIVLAAVVAVGLAWLRRRQVSA
ncbi:MAG: AzlC family ABC transporter permease [Mobilicoccus sp.]|nr:AzlC family ABC transporter permease [Mobilicoccus sp.]